PQPLEPAGLGVQHGELLRGVPAERLLARELLKHGLEGFTRPVLVAQRRVREPDVVVSRRHPAAARTSPHELLEARDRLLPPAVAAETHAAEALRAPAERR